MKLVRLLIVILALSGLACTEGTLESSRLSEFEPILFSNAMTGSETTTSNTSFKPSTGTCDKTTKDIEYSTTSASGPFQSISSASGVSLSAVIENCRKMGKLGNLDVLASSILIFTNGVDASKSIFFRAVSGQDTSAVSELKVVYDAPIVASAVPGFSTSLGSGTVNGTGPGNFVIENYRIGKPVPSVISGSNFKIVPAN